MGVGPRGPRGVGARPPNQVAYYVALAGILSLLLMLMCYFVYFCVKRVKELVQQDFSPTPTPTPRPPPPPKPSTTAYPVQPVVRDTATAMALLCRQLPAPTPVYPARSPAATRTEQEPTAPPAPPPTITVQPPESAPPEKLAAPPAAAVAVEAVR